MKATRDYESLRFSLDLYYDWPAEYPFKFIVPAAQRDELAALLEGQAVSERLSRNGRFVAATVLIKAFSAEDVISWYKRVSGVPGLIAL